eukprot:TRINITY_DN2853_c0_g1_i1.p1 TRINITY_DN2853_c0_g1~~TRINITY_DN2853_c0_g1_i1.p1  ORF type:complete len:1334 (-),score=372.55 TRINITY_DN2853_c0_g1_i1:132-4133(-)
MDTDENQTIDLKDYLGSEQVDIEAKKYKDHEWAEQTFQAAMVAVQNAMFTMSMASKRDEIQQQCNRMTSELMTAFDKAVPNVAVNYDNKMVALLIANGQTRLDNIRRQVNQLNSVLPSERPAFGSDETNEKYISRWELLNKRWRDNAQKHKPRQLSIVGEDNEIVSVDSGCCLGGIFKCLRSNNNSKSKGSQKGMRQIANGDDFILPASPEARRCMVLLAKVLVQAANPNVILWPDLEFGVREDGEDVSLHSVGLTFPVGSDSRLQRFISVLPDPYILEEFGLHFGISPVFQHLVVLGILTQNLDGVFNADLPELDEEEMLSHIQNCSDELSEISDLINEEGWPMSDVEYALLEHFVAEIRKCIETGLMQYQLFFSGQPALLTYSLELLKLTLQTHNSAFLMFGPGEDLDQRLRLMQKRIDFKDEVQRCVKNGITDWFHERRASVKNINISSTSNTSSTLPSQCCVCGCTALQEISTAASQSDSNQHHECDLCERSYCRDCAGVLMIKRSRCSYTCVKCPVLVWKKQKKQSQAGMGLSAEQIDADEIKLIRAANLCQQVLRSFKADEKSFSFVFEEIFVQDSVEEGDGISNSVMASSWLLRQRSAVLLRTSSYKSQQQNKNEDDISLNEEIGYLLQMVQHFRSSRACYAMMELCTALHGVKRIVNRAGIMDNSFDIIDDSFIHTLLDQWVRSMAVFVHSCCIPNCLKQDSWDAISQTDLFSSSVPDVAVLLSNFFSWYLKWPGALSRSRMVVTAQRLLFDAVIGFGRHQAASFMDMISMPTSSNSKTSSTSSSSNTGSSIGGHHRRSSSGAKHYNPSEDPTTIFHDICHLKNLEEDTHIAYIKKMGIHLNNLMALLEQLENNLVDAVEEALASVPSEGGEVLSIDDLNVFLVQLKLHRGKHIPKLDLMSHSDPYVYMSIMDALHTSKGGFFGYDRSSTSFNKKDPTWENENFQFTCVHSSSSLILEVMDQDEVHPDEDDFIGVGEIELKALLDQAARAPQGDVVKRENLKVPLTSDHDSRGELYISLEAESLSLRDAVVVQLNDLLNDNIAALAEKVGKHLLPTLLEQLVATNEHFDGDHDPVERIISSMKKEGNWPSMSGRRGPEFHKKAVNCLTTIYDCCSWDDREKVDAIADKALRYLLVIVKNFTPHMQDAVTKEFLWSIWCLICKHMLVWLLPPLSSPLGIKRKTKKRWFKRQSSGTGFLSSQQVSMLLLLWTRFVRFFTADSDGEGLDENSCYLRSGPLPECLVMWFDDNDSLEADVGTLHMQLISRSENENDNPEKTFRLGTPLSMPHALDLRHILSVMRFRKHPRLKQMRNWRVVREIKDLMHDK